MDESGKGRHAPGPLLLNGLTAAVAIVFTIFIVLNPEPAFNAAVQGLKVWWDIVFPALLPFFIGSEILMGLGVVHFMGVLLEPFMRPLFNVPGAGSFVLAMGLASGYPIGAMLTARLREQELCSRTEGERLMSFANTADPLFMTGAMNGVRTSEKQACALRILVRIALRQIGEKPSLGHEYTEPAPLALRASRATSEKGPPPCNLREGPKHA